MIKRILVGLPGNDFLPSTINQAVTLAMQHNAVLTGISVLDELQAMAVGPLPMGASRYAHELVEHRLDSARVHVESEIQQFTDACSAMNIRHDVVREVGEPLSKFIDQARYHDLMIFGLQSLFEYQVIPDPQAALLQLVESGVRPLIATSKGFYPVKRVLIAYSGSMESAKAMKRFVQMRLWPETKLRIVNFDKNEHHGKQLLKDAAKYCRAHGFEVETECVPGSPRDQLVTYSESWGADLTVIGNSAKNLLVRRIFGETALQTIRNTKRPLFLA